MFDDAWKKTVFSGNYLKVLTLKNNQFYKYLKMNCTFTHHLFRL